MCFRIRSIFRKILELPIRDKIARLKYVPEKDINKIDDVVEDLEMDIKI